MTCRSLVSAPIPEERDMASFPTHDTGLLESRLTPERVDVDMDESLTRVRDALEPSLFLLCFLEKPARGLEKRGRSGRSDPLRVILHLLLGHLRLKQWELTREEWGGVVRG